MVDHYSSLVSLRALKDEKAPTWLAAFLNGWVARYGWCHRLRTDGSGSFNDIVTMAYSFGVVWEPTPAYHPQANGRCERVNRVVIEMFRTVLASAPLLNKTFPALQLILENFIEWNINNTATRHLGWRSPAQVAQVPQTPHDVRFFPGRQLSVLPGVRRGDKSFLKGIIVTCVTQLPSGAVAVQNPLTGNIATMHTSRLDILPDAFTPMPDKPYDNVVPPRAPPPPPPGPSPLPLPIPIPPLVAPHAPPAAGPEQPRPDRHQPVAGCPPPPEPQPPRARPQRTCVCNPSPPWQHPHCGLTQSRENTSPTSGTDPDHTDSLSVLVQQCMSCHAVADHPPLDLLCRLQSQAGTRKGLTVTQALKQPGVSVAGILEAQLRELQGWQHKGTYMEIDNMQFKQLLNKGAQHLMTTWVISLKDPPSSSDPHAPAHGDIMIKARCCARGDMDPNGRDMEVSSPTLPFDSIRMLIHAAGNQPITVADVTQAYLNAKYEEICYVISPPRLANGNLAPSKQPYWALKSCVYGAKDAGLRWSLELTSTLTKNGYVESTTDPCVYIKQNTKTGSLTVLAFLVDDFLGFGPELDIMSLGYKLGKCTTLTAEGDSSKIAGMVLTKHSTGYSLSSPKHEQAVGSSSPSPWTRPASTPWPSMVQWNEGLAVLCAALVTSFRSVVGSLMWLAYACRPDLAFGSGALARRAHCATQQAHSLADRLAKFVNTHPGRILLGCAVPTKDQAFHCFADASWASKSESYRSTTGFAVMLAPATDDPPSAGSLVSWKSKVQQRHARSSMAAELTALTHAAAHALYLRGLFTELTGLFLPITIWTDSRDVIDAIMASRRTLPKDRSLVLAMAYLRDLNTHERQLTFKWLPSSSNLADELTKPMTSTRLTSL